MEKKYELTNETINYDGRTLHRIKAIKDFNNVKKEYIGGFIESEDNLSQEGNCWIYSNAIVCGNARVHGNARVFDIAEVYDNAIICDDAKVYDNAKVSGNAIVCGNARVFDNADVYGNAEVFDHAIVCDDTILYSNAIVCGNAKINKSISNTSMYFTVGPIGSRNDFTTFIKTDDTIHVNCGCFSGTIDEFTEKVLETHKDNKHAIDYLAVIEFVKIKFRCN